MSWGTHGSGWRVSPDVFGDEWHIRIVPMPEPASAQRSPDWNERGQIDRLVMDGFTDSGATDDRIATVLLQIYDELTNADFSSRLPVPTVDPQGLLCGMDMELLGTLLRALTLGALRIEPIARAPFPSFPDRPEEPVEPHLDVPKVSAASPAGVPRAPSSGCSSTRTRRFLLPGAIRGIRGLTSYLNRHAGAQLLVVGHTDTTGDAQYNLTLSVQRAKSDSGLSEKRRRRLG